jgi:hypothetical protein
MQHRQKTDAGAQVSGIGGDSHQGFGGGAGEHVINRPFSDFMTGTTIRIDGGATPTL